MTARAAVRRSRKVAAPEQPELPFDRAGTVPVPAAGTVAILRIDDWLRLRGGGSGDAFAPGATAGPYDHQLLEWLKGGEPPNRYPAGVHRAPDGRVLSAGAGDVAKGCPPPRAGRTKRGIETEVGIALKRLGLVMKRAWWQGRREARYFTSPGWGMPQ